MVCYLLNLADDLQKWLVYGEIAPEVLAMTQEFGAYAGNLAPACELR
jgi:hypothetical protein